MTEKANENGFYQKVKSFGVDEASFQKIGKPKEEITNVEEIQTSSKDLLALKIEFGKRFVRFFVKEIYKEGKGDEQTEESKISGPFLKKDFNSQYPELAEQISTHISSEKRHKRNETERRTLQTANR